MQKSIFSFLFALFFLTGLFAPNATIAQTSDISQEVVAAIRSGNARDIAKHFGTTVDLKIPDNEGSYSRNQAELILRNFFSRNAPAGFTVQHQGPSRDGSVYVIGSYRAQNGSTYRTYFLVKKIADKMVLNLLQFDLQ